MDLPVRVRIVGAPSACPSGISEPWRDIARLVASQLSARFGERVAVEYYDLFSPEMDDFPEALALVREGKAGIPLVFVGDRMLSAGGKVSVPAIRKALEALGL
jgi:disulfide oxidoreductase YuzD